MQKEPTVNKITAPFHVKAVIHAHAVGPMFPLRHVMHVKILCQINRVESKCGIGSVSAANELAAAKAQIKPTFNARLLAKICRRARPASLISVVSPMIAKSKMLSIAKLKDRQ